MVCVTGRVVCAEGVAPAVDLCLHEGGRVGIASTSVRDWRARVILIGGGGGGGGGGNIMFVCLCCTHILYCAHVLYCAHILINAHMF